MHVRCPHCHNPIEVLDESSFRDILCDSCGSCFSLVGGVDPTQSLDSTARTLGPFELIEQVGVGAHGAVWKARDKRLDRTVALKIPRKEQLSAAEHEQFFREARAAAQLRHPNIVSVHEVGKADETVFIVSDFVEGANLREYLSAGPLSPAQAVTLGTKIARAVQHAHDSGVIHRDLKPGNVMIDVDGEPYIMDFGLAKRDAGEITMTMDGRVLGTPAYMSPEQARGEAHHVTAASDIYSLGIILYELLTGTLPFRGDTRMMILQILRDEPTSPRKLNRAITRDLETIVLKCLEKEPASRYHSSRELASDLDRWLNGEPISARPLGRFDRTVRWCRRNPSSAALGLSVAVIALMLPVFAIVSLALSVAVQQRNIAQTQNAIANEQRNLADVRLREAEKARQKADIEQQLARKSEAMAVQNQAMAQQNQAEADRQGAMARQQRDRAEYEAYVASIGLVDSKIEENAFVDARRLLDGTHPALRNWEWGRLVHLCNQTVSDFDLGARVEAVDVSPDGHRFATGGWDGTATVWDIAAGAAVTRIQHEGLYVHSVSFSPDGKYLATGSNAAEAMIRIWNTETGQPVSPPLAGHSDAVTSVCFSPSGKWLASTSFDSEVRLWNVEDVAAPREEQVLRGHKWWVWDAAFSPDETRLAAASHDGTAIVWDLETGRGTPPFTGHRGPIYAIRFLPDGERVATGGHDGRVLVWRPGSLQPLDFRTLIYGGVPPPPKYVVLGRHSAPVRSIATIDQGTKVLLASAGHDNTIKLWDVDEVSLLHTMRGHGSWVRQCAFSPDGRWIVSGGYDHSAKLWHIEGYEELRVLRGRFLRGHVDDVMSAAFSPDGSRIATASRDRTVKIWGADSGEELLVLDEGHSFLASHAQFFADGRRLLTSAMDNTARIWDVSSGTELFALSGTGPNAAAAISADGRYILTGSDSHQAKLWSGETGEWLRDLDGHRHRVTAVAFEHGSRYLFTGDSSGLGFLWDRQTGQRIARLDVHTSEIIGASFLPDGRRLITASADKTVAQFDLSDVATDPASVAEVKSITLRHDDSVISLSTSPDGLRALTATRDGAVCLWDLDTARRVTTMNFGARGVNAATLSPDGNVALTVHEGEQTVRLWNLASAREIEAPGRDGRPGPFLDATHGGPVWSAIFAPHAQAVLTVGGNAARLWDLHGGQAGRRELMTFSPHGAVTSADFSPDGTRVVTASWDNSARIWNAETGTATLKLANGHNAYVNSAVFSPDGTSVLTGSDDGNAILWDAQTAEILRRFTGHSDRVHCVRFSRDGTRIVTASSDKTARIWNVQTGEVLRTLVGHEWGILAAAFSEDGRLVVTGSDDSSARIWEAATGQCRHVLKGHTIAVTSVCFSPDSSRAMTGSDDTRAKLWDTATGKELLTLKGHTAEVTSVAFSPDGRRVLTASRDGSAIVWLAADWQLSPIPE